jgi:hypothetical protein
MSRKKTKSTRMFTDIQGRSWTVKFTRDLIELIKELLNIDLVVAMDKADGPVDALGKPPTNLVNVLLVVCMPDIEKRGITQQEFLEPLRETAFYSQATRAALLALADTFPKTLAAKVIVEAERQKRL